MAGSVNSKQRAFNRLRQYCYSELVVSSPAMAVTIASTHCAYPQGDGQAELTWVISV